MNKEYMNKRTGEITDNHGIAMEWYRGHDEVAIIVYDEKRNEWTTRCEWVW